MTLDQLPLEIQQRNEEARARRLGIPLTVGNRWKLGHAPSQYEELAEKCQRRHHWRFAARIWQLAQHASLGRDRAFRYEQQARACFAKIKR